MFIKVFSNEKEIILDIDAIDKEKLEIVIKKVRTKFIKEFIKRGRRKDGKWGFRVDFPNNKRKLEFPKWLKYEDIVKTMLNDYDLHISIPTEQIRKRFLDEGLVCRIIPIENGHLLL